MAKIRVILPSVTNPSLLPDQVRPYPPTLCNSSLTVGLSPFLYASPGSVGIVRAPVPILQIHSDGGGSGDVHPARYVPHNLSVRMISVIYVRCGD